MLPLVNKNYEGWLTIPKTFANDANDIIFDGGVMAISWLNRLCPEKVIEWENTVNLGVLSTALSHASGWIHLTSIPGRVKNVLLADNTHEMTKACLQLIRSVASIVKFVFDIKVIQHTVGYKVARTIKFGTWFIYGTIIIVEALNEMLDSGCASMNVLNLAKNCLFFSVGTMNLINDPTLNRYILPVGTGLICTASTWIIANEAQKVLEGNQAIKAN